MSTAPNILVVDDDVDIIDVISVYLSNAGFNVVVAQNGDQMRQHLDTHAVALVLLDLVIPHEDGMALAKSLRKVSSVPLIMMTGKGDDTDRIIGLEVAADDFIMKPFNQRELLARIRSLLRRSNELSVPAVHQSEGPKLSFNGWMVSLQSRELWNPEGQPVNLTLGEFSLLEVFLNAPNCVLSRDSLLEKTRRFNEDAFDRTIDVLILRLRRKIEANPSNPQLICTERGLGYIFRARVVQR